MNIMQLRLTSARNRISPHFVFNVLNNKIASSNAQEANELLELSRLIRANLDLSCQMVVCLHDELDFVQRYVNVERSLLGGDFEYHIKVSEGIDTRKICIPSMFVQILVENAFVHGLRGWEGHKILVILIERVDQGTRVTVSDNGPGFDIRSTGKKRTGLSIISQTMAVINERNKAKMSFTLHNRQSEDGEVVGCDASIFLPDQMKFPI